MELKISFDARGLENALRDPDMIKGPVRDFLVRSAFLVEAKAKEKAPVDTGRLRNSIATQIAQTRAIVAANVLYAPFVEFGTKPHFPPPAALQPWARRHGFPKGMAGAYMVARAIARRGTRAQPFMAPALQQSLAAIRLEWGNMLRAIEQRWAQKGKS